MRKENNEKKEKDIATGISDEDEKFARGVEERLRTENLDSYEPCVPKKTTAKNDYQFLDFCIHGDRLSLVEYMEYSVRMTFKDG